MGGGGGVNRVTIAAAEARCTAYQTNTSTRWSSVCSTVQASVPTARGPKVNDVKGRLARQVVNRARQKRVAAGRGKVVRHRLPIDAGWCPGGQTGNAGPPTTWSAPRPGANVTFDVSADLATLTQNTKR